jgi:hypothetical protein
LLEFLSAACWVVWHRLNGGGAAAAGAAVYGWVMDKMPQLKPKQISGALHAIGKLNLYNAELVGALVQVWSQLVRSAIGQPGLMT